MSSGNSSVGKRYITSKWKRSVEGAESVAVRILLHLIINGLFFFTLFGIRLVQWHCEAKHYNKQKVAKQEKQKKVFFLCRNII